MRDQLSAAEANRRFYEAKAAEYEATEYCTFGEQPQHQLRNLLARAMAAANSPRRVLDAGGGSGNASIQLAALGVEPVLVDVSTAMARRWIEKARRLGIEPRVEIASLEDFFAADGREWDLIVFSSVLHHIEDPTSLMLSAAGRLAPGGTIATIFDPLSSTPMRGLIRRLDYLLWILRNSPASLPPIVARRVGIGKEKGAGDSLGTMAERHAMTGLDDDALVGALADRGLEVVMHERSYHARLGAMRALARILRTPTNFSLVVRRPIG